MNRPWVMNLSENRIVRTLLMAGLLITAASCSESETNSPEYVGSIYTASDEAEPGNTLAFAEPAALSLSSGQAAFTLDDIVLVSKVRLDRTAFQYTFQLSLTHNGTEPVTDVSAVVSSSNPSTFIIDGEVDVGDLEPGESVTVPDTITFLHDRSVEFGDSNLSISFSGAAPAAAVRYIGRYDDSDPDAVRLSWSGTGFVVRFDGTGASATLRGGDFYTVVVDGVVAIERLAVSSIDTSYVLASGLPSGEHIIEVYRRPSADVGPTVVSGVDVEGILLPVPAPARQIEIVSDSWATGYGVDGPNGFCRYSSATEDHFKSWSAIAGRMVQAEVSNVSLNGRGVIQNCCGSLAPPMSAVYDDIILEDAFSVGTIRPADAVFVSIGVNDQEGPQSLLPPGFDFAYADLLEQVRGLHPNALIAAVFPRDEPDPAFEEMHLVAIQSAIAMRAAAGDTNVQLADVELPNLIDFGCDFHPGALTHIGMADKAATFLNEQLGW